jgi:phenylacetic acid degradation operon negative regulatory protein
VARPQTMLFMLLGHHIAGRGVAVSSGTLLEVLGRLGVSVHAGRATLTRMVRRGYLVRHRQGRKTYFSLTAHAIELLSEGGERLFASPDPDESRGNWTLLSFSIPEAERANRHSLRVALGWLGFGSVRNGLWIAPGAVPVSDTIAKLGLQGNVEVFVGRPVPPTRLNELVAAAWDLEAIRARYEAFLRRWEQPETHVDGPLATQVLLFTDWREALLEDPGLPLEHLSADWPAKAAYEVFRMRDEELAEEAARELDELLDALPLTGDPPADDT